MTYEEFKTRAARSDDAAEIDELCILWIRQALTESGVNGSIGYELLNIIEERCMP